MDSKQFDTRDLNLLINCLYQKGLCLKSDFIYKCEECGEQYVDLISLERQLCLSCKERKNRINSKKPVDITLLPPEHSTYSNDEISYDGFTLFANFTNNTKTPLTIQLKDFYIVSDNRQYSPKHVLNGYNLDEAIIMPKGIRSVAKIWKKSEISSLFGGDDEYAYISLYLPEDRKLLMYKFFFDEDEKWQLFDYYKK